MENEKLKEQLNFNAQKLKNNKAITLIALVVTIVVLLILSAVVIQITINGGLIDKTKIAKDKTNKEAIMEEIQVAYGEASTEYYVNNKPVASELENILIKADENAKVNGDIDELLVKYKGYEAILKNGKISTDKGVMQVHDETPGVLAGEGTEQSPYLVQSIEDLVAFSNNVNNGTSYEGQYVSLEQTLDFKSEKSYVDPKNMNSLITGNGFTPIGGKDFKYTYTNGADAFAAGEFTGNFFKGTFDGKENYIKNLYIDGQNDKQIGYAVGLFGANSGIIKNLRVTGDATGTMNYSKSLVESTFGVGGITGVNIYGTIDNCISYVNVKSVVNAQCHMGAAGIAAGNYNGTIKNSKNYGNVVGTDTGGSFEYLCGVGGVIAGCYGESTIDNCINYGNVNKEGSAQTEYGIGGFIGAATGKYKKENTQSPTGKGVTILNSKNYGNINVASNESAFGVLTHFIGIIGLTVNEDNTIQNCSSSCNINIPDAHRTNCGAMLAPMEAKVSVTDCNISGKCIVKNANDYVFGTIYIDDRESEVVSKFTRCNSDMDMEIYANPGSVAIGGYTDELEGTNYGGKISIYVDKIEATGDEKMSVIFEITGRHHSYWVNDKLFTENYKFDNTPR